MQTCVLTRFSRVRLFATLWTVARQAPLSMGFSRQEYWSGLPCPPPGDLPDPGIEPKSPVVPALQVDSLPLRHWASPWIRITDLKTNLIV